MSASRVIIKLRRFELVTDWLQVHLLAYAMLHSEWEN